MSRARNRYGRIFGIAIAALAAGGVGSAWADPINVSSGNINFLIFDGASFTLTGPSGAEISGEIGSANFGYVPPYACSSGSGACAGQTVNLSVSDSVTSNAGGNPSVNVIEGGMLIDGVRYAIDNFTYHITAGDVVTPLNGSVSSPFAFSAIAAGTSSTGLTTTVDWTGAGIATTMYGSTIGWGESDYTFSSAVSATPEPASVLLLGTGVAGFLLRRRSAVGSSLTGGCSP